MNSANVKDSQQLNFVIPVATSENPFCFFEWLFREEKFQDLQKYFIMESRIKGGNPHSKLYGYIDCEAIMAAYMFIESLPRQKRIEEKRKEVTKCYDHLNELYDSIQKEVSSQKLLRCFGIIHSILFKKYRALIEDTLQFPLEDIEYRHVFKEEFLNSLMSFPLYDKCDVGRKLFETKVLVNDFRNILLGYGVKIKFKRNPIKVQWEEREFFFLLLKFEDQHARVNHQNLPEIIKYKGNNKHFSYDNFRQFRKRLKKKLDDPTGNRFQTYMYKNPSLLDINKFFDDYINDVDNNMMKSGLKRS